MRRSRILPIVSLLSAFAWIACGGGDSGEGGPGGGGPGSCQSPDGKPKACSVTPESGGEGTLVVIHGVNFPTSSGSSVRVKFSGADALIPQSVEPTAIEVKVPGRATTGPINLEIDLGKGFVTYPGPTFTVTDEKPLPALKSLSPTSVTLGEPPPEITISGTGFRSSTEVLWNGETIPSLYSSSSSIKIHPTAEMLDAVKTHKVQVVSPPPGGGTSQETLEFKVVHGLQVVSAEARSATSVRVTFDRPVSTSTATARRNADRIYSFSPKLSVSEAQMEMGSGGRSVIVSLRDPQQPNVEYTVTVDKTRVTSAEGGILNGNDSDTFRAFNSNPIADGSFGADPGCGPAALSGPMGLGVLTTHLYVTEESGNQVQKLDISADVPEFLGFYGYDGTTTGFLTGAGSTAEGCPGGSTDHDEALVAPRGAPGLDPLTGNLYVADTARDRIVRFLVSASGGGETATFESFVRGDAAASESARWKSPVILGVIGKQLYVATSADQIRRLNFDGSREPDPFGAMGDGGGEFRFNLAEPPEDCEVDDPRLECAYDGSGLPAMAYDSNKRFLYVVEPGNHRVQRIRVDRDTGRLQVEMSNSAIGKGVTKFGNRNTHEVKGAGTGKGEFTNPSGIAMDRAGTLWVIDEAKGGRVQRFADSGTFQQEFLLGYVPGGIAFDGENRMWIADPLNGKVHRFQL
ncbi:MAG TPA: IPT/TIG domain-containing protein [Vulgatibacter sp.]|nr:IPT/TIG domain-containing protein [Vulgatibacter sp.]